MFSAARRGGFLVLICLVAIVATMLVPPIPQDPAYHAFVDTRTIAGVPNFWNVFSNIGFLIVGIYGLMRAQRLPARELLAGHITFCVGVALVAFGSAWYHYKPSTESLVWDRLPMSISFMALLALILGERVPLKPAGKLLWPLVIIGVASVFYWAWTEQRGAGDLRPYGLVQFLPLVLMPLLLLMFPGSKRSAMWLWYTFAGYGLAKIMELLDAQLYAATGLSGHSFKHLFSSVAVLFAVFAMLEMKAPQTPPGDDTH